MASPPLPLPPSPVLPLSSRAERDRWILEQRPERNRLDPWRPYAFLVEPEMGPAGAVIDAATVFLTNRECPFRCLMCDLWQNTLEETVPPGAIAAQIRHALERLPPAHHLKLYNAGSFFDPRAIPPDEYEAIAALAALFERVIVECHPALVGPECARFREMVEAGHWKYPALGPPASRPGGRETGSLGEGSEHSAPHGEGCRPVLEVAMGLETVHPEVLARLNKRMTLPQFRRAAEFLGASGIALRVFILVRPPWLSECEGMEWARRSLEFAWECGASACSLIPTRAGNGAMEALAAAGEFAPPSLASLEQVMEYGLERGTGRVFVDLWDLHRFSPCPDCSASRIERLREMNRTQQILPRVQCPSCGDGAP